MPITAADLRQDIYRLLDEVLETGVPLEIEHEGRRLRVVPTDGPSKLARCSPRPDYIAGDPDELIHLDWSQEWSS